MTKSIAIRKALNWRTVVLSTGEVSLDAKIRENDIAQFSMAGQAVRFVDIPADAGAGMGLFENLHGFESPGQFARALQESAMTNYGHAANEFIEFLIEDVNEKTNQVVVLAKDFIMMLGLPADADSQVLRVANKFALVAAAGELAIEAGIVLWPRGEVFTSVFKVFSDWLKEREGIGSMEDIQAIEHVRYFIQKHQVTRFERGVDNEGKFPESVREALGFIVDEKRGSGQSERLYCCYSPVWKHDVCNGRNAKSVAAALLAKGFLATEDRRLTITKRNKGKTYRVYAVRESILLEPKTKFGS